MGRNINNNPQQQNINANTQVVFTVKGFFGIITTILGLFIGFYTLVVVPKINDLKEFQKESNNQLKEFMFSEMNNMKESIRINTNTIQATNESLKDINKSLMDIANSGGSFESMIIPHSPKDGDDLADIVD